MIRILHVVTKMGYGGLEAMLMNYYRYIDREQIQFDFLVHRPEEADYHDEIRALGGKIFHLPQLNPFSSSYKKALADFFHTHPEYRLIHVHLNCMSSVVLKVAKACGVPYRIAHSHNSNQDRNLKYPIKMFYRRFIPEYATKLFACGNDAGYFLYGKEKFEVLNNAINASEFRFNEADYHALRQKFGFKDEELIIGNVGKFILQKNHVFILSIFSEVLKILPAKLLLIGEGELKESIENKASEMGLDQSVIFTGVRADISDLLKAMDIFLFPSLYEGLPVALIEAQAAGLPCLISDCIPEESIITDVVSRFSLENTAKQWADIAIDLRSKSRYDVYDDIVNSGYDIQENAKRLQNYYIRTYNGEENVCLY